MKNVWFRKLLILRQFQWNRTQEADGSIPFISTILLSFSSTQGSAVTIFCESLPDLEVAFRLFWRGNERR